MTNSFMILRFITSMHNSKSNAPSENAIYLYLLLIKNMKLTF